MLCISGRFQEKVGDSSTRFDNAFLYGDLDEDIYMKVPQVYCKTNDNCLSDLQKLMYGLKHAS